MRKVLHLRSSGQLLGAERVVLELAKYLPEFGYQSVLGIPIEAGQPPSEFAATAENLGYETVLLPIKGAFDTKILKSIRQLVQRNNIELIHSHGYREDFYTIFSRTDAKRVATNHLWKRTTWRLKAYAYLDAWLLRHFQSVIAVSQPVESDMIAAGIPNKLINTIANGIDSARFAELIEKKQAAKSLNIPADKIVIGTLSSLTIEKGINHLIEALAVLNTKAENFHLLIVGSGEEQVSLEQAVRHYNLGDNVSFAGRRSDISNVLSAIDIFALPSLNEGLPMALLEAMAAGKAVIATNVGDVHTVVNEHTGILIEPANANQIANSLTELANDTALIQQYGDTAKHYVEEHFSSYAMAKSYATIYDQVLTQ